MRIRLGPALAALGCALFVAEASAALDPVLEATALPDSHVGLLILAAAALSLSRWD